MVSSTLEKPNRHWVSTFAEHLCSIHGALLSFLKETVLLPLVNKLLFGSSQDSTGEPLTAQLVPSKELEALLAGLEKKIRSDASLYPGLAMEAHSATVRAGILKEVESIVEQALKLYSADRVGLVDYALESAGGTVIHTRCTET
ncbi:SUN domain-containing protein 2-like [Amblyraja radiata]|uniref:SUN domain-containing protein 2-like n=1 Tax=Amblyraja radiata TaxID=386614 RepID=UPI001403B58E|nr:SUN domain-containing protein 2-like [Amblyraja radiata]